MDKKFKSFDECKMYLEEKNLSFQTDEHKVEKIDVDKLEKINKKQNKQKKKKTHNSNLSVFDKYRRLSRVGKEEWLVEHGITHMKIVGRYDLKNNRVFSDVINPFTKKQIDFYYNGKDVLANNEKVLIQLKINPNPQSTNSALKFSVLRLSNQKKDMTTTKANRFDGLNNGSNNNQMWQTKLAASTWEEIERYQERERIYFNDFVTTTDVNNCTKQKHEIESINALIFILRRDGSVLPKKVPASYCKTCNRYYLSKWQFENISEYGTPLCQVIHEHGNKHSKQNSYYGNLNAESILHRSGYNVSSTENLSDAQRHTILVFLAESGLYPKSKIKGHLTWLIKCKEGDPKMSNAVGKWESDRMFIDTYKMGSNRVVGVRLIRHKH